VIEKLAEIVGEEWVISSDEAKLYSYPAFIPLK